MARRGGYGERRRMWTRRMTRRRSRDGGGEEMDGGKRGRAGGGGRVGGGGDMDGKEGEDTRKGRRRGGIEDEEVQGGGGDKEDEEGQEEEDGQEEEEEETKRRREEETWRMRKGRRSKDGGDDGVVSADGEVLPVEVWAPDYEGVNHGEEFLLVEGVIHLRGKELLACEGDGVFAKWSPGVSERVLDGGGLGGVAGEMLGQYGSNGEVGGISGDIEVAGGVGDLEDGGCGDGLFEKIEGMRRAGGDQDRKDLAEVLKVRLEGGVEDKDDGDSSWQGQERNEVGEGSWVGGIREGCDLRGIHTDAFSGDNVAEDREDLAEVLKVRLEGGAEDQDVIKVDDDTDFEEVVEDVVHGRLEGSGGIGESEWHHEELVVPEPRAEGGLVGVLLADTDLVEATAKVDLGDSRMPHKYDTRAKRKAMRNNKTTQYDTNVTSKPGAEHSERSKKSGNDERSVNLGSEHPRDDHHVLSEVERRCSQGNTLDDAENMVVEGGGDDCRADEDGSRRGQSGGPVNLTFVDNEDDTVTGDSKEDYVESTFKRKKSRGAKTNRLDSPEVAEPTLADNRVRRQPVVDETGTQIVRALNALPDDALYLFRFMHCLLGVPGS
ncbi:hypothetical protein CBR_g32106 [Chara braunii]|uniref:Uncharacterized protein n=1 Tax=Chara braunii TaxID=69332 RepID=A0A388LGJ7_CHABU|nr:hypothetical protein CBR_g32106 [Chara braunii]|eukprot:GBG81429.1 hypothetical protein CBR_g32106 [Chara braunii]